ncbi:mannose-6-phosphate isomerase [Aureimonas endophytica]|uniref:Mannose-6-phosphate isomerase n=1 Tax=Aureimonas endophytica TaxID=2027858 RepID=A0A916ZPI1_9HYPH|nr:AGE family epimerase/isomerase [Aureimonas endophytica]GGE06683.1 mannose-6-phosphate isomerase [Aureimonas endophytica]
MTTASTEPSFRQSAGHRRHLAELADRLFGLFETESLDPAGGFFALDAEGRAVTGAAGWPRGIHEVTRIVHCFAIGEKLGRPAARRFVEHGLDFIETRHRDREAGGWFWSVGETGPADATKQAYGHAFVMLAAAGATVCGHEAGPRLLADVDAVIDAHFWEEDWGAVIDGFERDWTPLGPYRGQNANMHLTEALMAAFEASGNPKFLERAERIAGLIIERHAAGLAWRVAEHFNADWTLDRDFAGDRMFRPPAMTPGHWLEWARLLLQLWIAGGKRHDWMAEGAEKLFANAVRWGWDETHGGFFYTTDFENNPAMREKLWWPTAEAMAAAHFLAEHRPSAFHEEWYRRSFEFIDRHFIDHRHGGWRPELSEDLRPQAELFHGVPDIYHSLQALLIPLFPATGSLTQVARPLGDAR